MVVERKRAVATGAWIAAEMAALVLVASIRFDYRDPGLVGRFTTSVRALPFGHGIDVEGYIRLTEYFRGLAPADSMMPPYCFRIIAPLAASAIPAAPLTALDLVDLASLLATLLVIDRAMRRMGLGNRARVIGGAMFAVSFPTFYYATVGFVDPVAVFAVALLLWCVVADAPVWGTAAVAVLAALVKETNAAFSILPLAFQAARGRRTLRDLGPRALIPLACVAAILGVHALAPFPDPGFTWKPSLASVAENLSRPRTYLSLALTVLIPASLATMSLVSGRAKAIGAPLLAVLGVGCVLASAMYLYSLFSAYTDGRIIWIVYPFAIPIAVAWFRSRETGGVPRSVPGVHRQPGHPGGAIGA
ncbi:MAG TPA: hypothetical protein VF363_13175 [Candidatus Eisenbacteria bacterium]